MLLPGLAAVVDYHHIFIAPHLDDIALSCGGIVAQQVALEQRVVVVTMCAGSPAVGQALAPFAAYLHAAWNLGDDPMAQRRVEDSRALVQLGADGVHMSDLDAIYRDPAYAQREAVFGLLIPADPLVAVTVAALQLLRAQNPMATLYLPLAVGGHVDHQAVWAAHLAVDSPLAFYEEFPYAVQPNAVYERIMALEEQLVPKLVSINAFLPRKIAALAEYQSQLSELFPIASMETTVVAYALSVDGHGRYSERLWLPKR